MPATVLNVGAGAGSYEPTRSRRHGGRAVGDDAGAASGRACRAPSTRPPRSLPFDDDAFDASLAAFTVHQWADIDRGLAELRRVTRGPVVVLTCDPDGARPVLARRVRTRGHRHRGRAISGDRARRRGTGCEQPCRGGADPARLHRRLRRGLLRPPRGAARSRRTPGELGVELRRSEGGRPVRARPQRRPRDRSLGRASTACCAPSPSSRGRSGWSSGWRSALDRGLDRLVRTREYPIAAVRLHLYHGRAAVTPGSNIRRSERPRAERRSAARPFLCGEVLTPADPPCPVKAHASAPRTRLFPWHCRSRCSSIRWPSDDATSATAGTFREVDASAPALRVGELSTQRGDGIFETIAVVDGHVQEAEAHLARLVRSAEICELPVPNVAAVACGDRLRARAGPRGGRAGHEARAQPRRRARPGADRVAERQRGLRLRPTRARNGIRVVTLDRGYDRGVAERAPWLLLGAKTLSYAVNMAALREAHRRGADDTIFVTSDGYVMEGPTSCVIARIDDVFVTPRPSGSILHGTTQISLFEHLAASRLPRRRARHHRRRAAERGCRWLVSSVRLAAPIIELDGVAFAHRRRAHGSLQRLPAEPRD